MEVEGSPTVQVRRTNMKPKVVINQKFGSKARYMVEEVQESGQSGCPGLAIPQKGPSLYRCTLELPECSVVSGTFKKKKDAEQSAAEIALEKLGIDHAAKDPKEEDPWDAFTNRVTYIFSDEFSSSLHPLSGHLRAAWKREGDICGSVPASVIAACDAKLKNLCRFLNSMSESNPLLASAIVMRAVTQLSGSVVTSKGQLSVKKLNPYPPEIIELPDIEQSCSTKCISVKAIRIPSSLEKPIQPVTLDVASAGYYLDSIALELGLTDANRILLSRTIGKASSETRLYFAAPKSYDLDLSSDFAKGNGGHSKGPFNARASYFSGQDICGDAIMASIGYTWKSKDLFHEDLPFQSYYRMLIGKIPGGIYKLSREATLAAELPSIFTTKSNWRGSFPKEILCSFCRQHRLSEPVFSSISVPLKASFESSRSPKKLKIGEMAEQEAEFANGETVNGNKESVGSASTSKCEVKIFSKSQDMILECSPREIYKKQTDAINNAALKILSWLNAYFKDLSMPLEKLTSSANALDIRFHPENFSKEFLLCSSIHNADHIGRQVGKVLESESPNKLEQCVHSLRIEGSDSGVYPSSGSLACVSYSVTLVREGEPMKVLLESKDEWEFEIGSGAVISPLEAVVTQMSVGQSSFFNVDLPSQEFILAAAGDTRSLLSLLTSSPCYLDYSITLLGVTEPPEERMEQALFSPPLSKQRVEFALVHIKKSCATTLIDFGCGSGSLLDSLLDYPTSLAKVVGVDISQKGLTRAAKILHTKLSAKSDTGIKSAILYEGSITEYDSQLCGFDIGTCLEVIEHMEEEQASLFGNVALSYFRPKILIVSTPNYEYNVILQKSSLTSQEDDPDDKSQSQPCKFRNHDHKFEWTREQFNRWACELADRHNYSVEFGGVGGSADVEPGFASQIAVFEREGLLQENGLPRNEHSEQPCNVLWKWSPNST